MDTNQVIAGVLALVIVTAVLLVGNTVNTNLSSSLNTGLTGNAAATSGNITEKSENAFALTANVPTILGATIILLALLGLAVIYRG